MFNDKKCFYCQKNSVDGITSVLCRKCKETNFEIARMSDLKLLVQVIKDIRKNIIASTKKRHTIQRLSQNYIKRYDNAHLTPLYLWGLLKRQKMKCALTGRPLEKGKIHLDHIIPKSRGGTHSLNNLRFVNILPNMFKWNSLDSELVTLCQDILMTIGNK
jgi:CRISPR/Cas system Type II protein with McrA/HNH and RuvC-like nuclease domain